MLSIEEMSDRFEIQDLMVGYCYAVDNKDFDALDGYFTDDAVIDYSEMVGVKGSLADIKSFLAASLGPVPMSQHAVSTTQYSFDGDRCETRSVCTNPMVVPGDDGEPQTFTPENFEGAGPLDGAIVEIPIADMVADLHT